MVAEHPAEAQDDRAASEAGEQSAGLFGRVRADRLGSQIDGRRDKQRPSAVVGVEKRAGADDETIGAEVMRRCRE